MIESPPDWGRFVSAATQGLNNTKHVAEVEFQVNNFRSAERPMFRYMEEKGIPYTAVVIVSHPSDSTTYLGFDEAADKFPPNWNSAL